MPRPDPPEENIHAPEKKRPKIDRSNITLGMLIVCTRVYSVFPNVRMPICIYTDYNDINDTFNEVSIESQVEEETLSYSFPVQSQVCDHSEETADLLLDEGIFTCVC